MSSVFGVIRVDKVTHNKEKYDLHCVDIETGESAGIIGSSYIVPIGTRFYWETNLSTNKTEVRIMREG